MTVAHVPWLMHRVYQLEVRGLCTRRVYARAHRYPPAVQERDGAPCLFDQTHANTRNQTPWTSWSSHTRVEAVRKPDREPLTGSSSVAAERRWPFVGCACCAVLPTPRRAVPTRIAAAECTEMGLIMLPRSCLAAYNAQHECLSTTALALQFFAYCQSVGEHCSHL